LFFKTWYRLREFVEIAWPLLIVGSVILALAQYYSITGILNEALSPLTVGLLGLPVVTGMTLIFGVLRKELSLLMLIQALGTAEIASVMTSQQIVTFTIFVMFYVPCVATIGILMKETGTRVTAYATVATLVLAVAAGVLTRLAFGLF
jgi:ferrous iron transport protein B